MLVKCFHLSSKNRQHQGMKEAPTCSQSWQQNAAQIPPCCLPHSDVPDSTGHPHDSHYHLPVPQMCWQMSTRLARLAGLARLSHVGGELSQGPLADQAHEADDREEMC